MAWEGSISSGYEPGVWSDTVGGNFASVTLLGPWGILFHCTPAFSFKTMPTSQVVKRIEECGT